MFRDRKSFTINPPSQPDILWLRDESFEEPTNFPGPDVLAQNIFEDLEAALE
jgi:hypothetical protein